jgi:hypothetical protein
MLNLLKNKDIDGLATALVLSLMRTYPTHSVTPSINNKHHTLDRRYPRTIQFNSRLAFDGLDLEGGGGLTHT